jgi:hypothetical protein
MFIGLITLLIITILKSCEDHRELATTRLKFRLVIKLPEEIKHVLKITLFFDKSIFIQ